MCVAGLADAGGHDEDVVLLSSMEFPTPTSRRPPRLGVDTVRGVWPRNSGVFGIDTGRRAWLTLTAAVEAGLDCSPSGSGSLSMLGGSTSVRGATAAEGEGATNIGSGGCSASCPPPGVGAELRLGAVPKRIASARVAPLPPGMLLKLPRRLPSLLVIEARRSGMLAMATNGASAAPLMEFLRARAFPTKQATSRGAPSPPACCTVLFALWPGCTSLSTEDPNSVKASVSVSAVEAETSRSMMVCTAKDGRSGAEFGRTKASEIRSDSRGSKLSSSKSLRKQSAFLSVFRGLGLSYDGLPIDIRPSSITLQDCSSKQRLSRTITGDNKSGMAETRLDR